MLTVISSHELALSGAAQKRLWAAFIDRGTSHSANASTLPYIMRRCEQEQISYVLEAAPGIGYYIKLRSKK